MQGWDVVGAQWEIAKHGALGYVPQEGGLFEFLTVQVVILLSSFFFGHTLTLPHTKAHEHSLS